MSENAFTDFAKGKPWAVVAVAVVLLLGVVWLDWWTGPDFVMGEFYLLPVAMVTLLVGYRAGLVMAILTVIVWGVTLVVAGGLSVLLHG